MTSFEPALNPVLEVEPDLVHHCPEAALLVALDATLAAVESTLWDEHRPESELLLDLNTQPGTACLTAHMVVFGTSQLRHLLRLHLTEIKRVFPFHFPY